MGEDQRQLVGYASAEEAQALHGYGKAGLPGCGFGQRGAEKRLFVVRQMVEQRDVRLEKVPLGREISFSFPIKEL